MHSLTPEQLIEQLKLAGIHDQRVLGAMSNIKRSDFVPKNLLEYAYDNQALPIEYGQTISQPYVVAKMTQTLLSKGSPQSVLEIGTGSGYQAAILSLLFKEVYTVERIEGLYQLALQTLSNYSNIHMKYGDGYLGWPDYAPFDRIIVTAAVRDVPHALLAQLSTEQGQMVLPVGDPHQQVLEVITREGNEYSVEALDNVIFVPMLPGKD